MSNKLANPALFLDRDGVINLDFGFVSEIKNFKFNSGIFELCKFFMELNFKIIIITNQSGIGRGMFSLSQFHTLNNWMLEQFANKGIRIDLVLVSALDPDKKLISDFELKFRKPGSGMIYAAQEIFKLNLQKSLLIGDKESDIQAGRKAGIENLYLISKSDIELNGAIQFADLEECLVELRKKFKLLC
jgi:D-glycero-D-manno-heptose 1,7-bisphosphate phosphatase